ncbi:MAG TPA: UDP-N-acetylmuramoyl-L-alanyl-D-glutamate--2,6-diaminopimelate ligase [candidate division Zixibacteria bacterium]|nr:UDP-N-acetylmuramoyl-L-alanyl-D-glutamate--2,6-diaminopimelate ligase [candidate division Zixibacteria bacterium]
MRLEELFESWEIIETGGDLDREIAGLAYDSRRVKKGDLFFAVPGEKADGHDFIPEAIGRGAAAVVASRRPAAPGSAAWIRVEDVRRALGLWSARYFGKPSARLRLAGVTGTNGKTTVTYLLEAMFAAAGLEPGVIGTISYRFRDRSVPAPQTTPESLDLQALLAEMAAAGVEAVAMEVSSHALVQQRVRGVEFDAALFTNLSRDHLDYHAGMDDYFEAKSRLFTDYLPASTKPGKAAVIHGGDPRGPELLERARRAGARVLSYGRDERWDVHPVDVVSDVRGLRGKIRMPGRTIEFSSALIGAANLENLLGAAAAGVALGLSTEAIRAGIERLRTVPGRLEKIENRRDIAVLVDYAHTPDALEKVLRAVRPLARGRVLTVFGCGGDRDRGKRPLMGEIAARLSDLVFVTSDNPRSEEPRRIASEVESGVLKTGLERIDAHVEPGAGRGYLVEVDRRAAIRAALERARPGDVVLIAGKGHEDYQILGSEKIHFDDREVAREELNRLGGA